MCADTGLRLLTLADVSKHRLGRSHNMSQGGSGSIADFRSVTSCQHKKHTFCDHVSDAGTDPIPPDPDPEDPGDHREIQYMYSTL